MQQNIRSNFNMLRPYEPQLWRLGALAERYFTEDPNTSLLKLRQFAELLAQSFAGPQALAQRVDTGEAGRWRKFTRALVEALLVDDPEQGGVGDGTERASA